MLPPLRASLAWCLALSTLVAAGRAEELGTEPAPPAPSADQEITVPEGPPESVVRRLNGKLEKEPVVHVRGSFGAATLYRAHAGPEGLRYRAVLAPPDSALPAVIGWSEIEGVDGLRTGPDAGSIIMGAVIGGILVGAIASLTTEPCDKDKLFTFFCGNNDDIVWQAGLVGALMGAGAGVSASERQRWGPLWVADVRDRSSSVEGAEEGGR